MSSSEKGLRFFRHCSGEELQLFEAVVDYVRGRARRAYVRAVETMAVVAAMIVAVPAVMLLRKA